MKWKNKVGVIGAGSWGTAIAGVLSEKGITTSLWGHRPEHIDKLKRDKTNTKYLPSYLFKENLHPTTSFKDAVTDTPVICMVVPSQVFRSVFCQLIEFINTDCVVISAVKGIENDSLMTMTEVMRQEIARLNPVYKIELAVLSGPSFAQEVANKTPTAVTIGCEKLDTAKQLQKRLVTDFFRIYASCDVIGLELSAAFKNIIAIATGICDGLGYGLNTRAALITRGLAEITRYGTAMGADPQTFSGLSGMGDLILTCTGDLSRNRNVGLQLGKGKNIEQILCGMEMVAEGVKTTLSGYKLAKKSNTDMPITEQMYKILYEKKDCSKAVQDLLTRELKME